ncbi:hypothetical protein MCOR02_007420 [Pyricularia oryzae]|nr:hypothetical protein MCOR02_007420 [Pyricularia oryzae]KAI6322709.1 hypothetical protein MCOR34_002123 [Pyricularia oryzae]KAI6444635.1 hypothetical protein MCOR17_011138 [Pyricularia oryzae]KAI6512524.1 hypothetical protein MCOR13_000313 [Pyricularia oryzae]KAI6602130.1 hypothetical protein MCOR04_002039 [Pyricularia oryzae]
MRSHLARNACRASQRSPASRQLLTSITAPPSSSLLCSRDLHHPRRQPHICDRLTQDLAGRYGKRSFFGPFKKPPREVQPPQMVPGYGVLLDFTANEQDNVRLPAVEVIQKAVTDLFSSPIIRQTGLNSTQARCALRAMLYLRDNSGLANTSDKLGLSASCLRKILRAAQKKRPQDDGQDYMELAKLAFDGLRPSLKDEEALNWWTEYLVAIFNTGGSTHALEELKTWLDSQPPILSEAAKELLVLMFRKFSQQGEHPALSELLKILRARGLSTHNSFIDSMVAYHASLGQADDAFLWLGKIPGTPSSNSLLALIKLADQQPNLSNTVTGIFLELCDQKSPLPVSSWSAVLQWALCQQNMDFSNLETFIRTKLAKNKKLQPEELLPGNTLDHLLMAAMDRKQYVLAERITDWALKRVRSERGLPFRAKAMRLEWRLAANDLPGAHEAYQSIITEDLSVLDLGPTQQSALNRYLQVLCSQEVAQSARVLPTLSTLEEHRVHLEPETIGYVAKYLLENDLEYELIDTLSIHATNFSISERTILINKMLEFCLDITRSTARAWNTYTLLRQYFPDMKRDPRVRMMHAFFARKRPDMAVLVFGHMRAHDNPEMKPDLDVYVAVLECLGRHPDIDSLKLVHNMFKMDTTIQPTTRLYNAMMMAYTGCGEPFKSLEFWREISNSPEGPTYETLTLFFWTCQKIGPGVEKANEVWEKLMRMNVEIPSEVFSAYCGAMSSKGKLDTVKQLLLGMDGTVGYYPDTATLRIIYDGLPNQTLQDEFENFALHRFPDTWNELVTVIPRKKSRELVRSKFRYSRVHDMKA